MPSSGLRISQRNCEALLAAEAAGVKIIIATGRRQAYAMPLISQVGLQSTSVMVSSNGAVIRRFDGELIARQFLPAPTARRLCAELGGYGTLVFTFDREGPGGLVSENLERLQRLIQRWVEANRPYLTEVTPIEQAFDGPELPIQGMVCGTVIEMKRAEGVLQARGFGDLMSMHRTEYAVRDLSILDLLPLGCSKGAAIHHLAQAWNLQQDEIMAIGDNLNDLEMLRYAGRPVVMANASEETVALARESGWEFTASNDEDGVARVIESVLVQPAPVDGLESSGVREEAPEGEDTMLEWVQ